MSQQHRKARALAVWWTLCSVPDDAIPELTRLHLHLARDVPDAIYEEACRRMLGTWRYFRPPMPADILRECARVRADCREWQRRVDAEASEMRGGERCVSIDEARERLVELEQWQPQSAPERLARSVLLLAYRACERRRGQRNEQLDASTGGGAWQG